MSRVFKSEEELMEAITSCPGPLLVSRINDHELVVIGPGRTERLNYEQTCGFIIGFLAATGSSLEE